MLQKYFSLDSFNIWIEKATWCYNGWLWISLTG